MIRLGRSWLSLRGSVRISADSGRLTSLGLHYTGLLWKGSLVPGDALIISGTTGFPLVPLGLVEV